MIEGTVVQGREGIIHVKLFGVNQSSKDVDAVVDTGFTSFLALRPDTIAALGLLRTSVEPFVLGDGSVVDLTTYWVDLEWDGERLPSARSIRGRHAPHRDGHDGRLPPFDGDMERRPSASLAAN